MENERQIRIMIVDDHPLVRAGICAIIGLQPDMQIVGEFDDAQVAISQVEAKRPDVVLMDLRLPGMTGLEAIRLLRRNSSSVRVIVLTTYEGDEDIYQALEAGAASYIVKGMKHDRLLQGIRRVHLGKSYLPPEVSKVVDERPPDELSAREREVLLLLAEGLSNRDIAAELGIAEKTVKCHVGMILSLFGVKDRTNAVLTAIRRGYVKL
ncbi:MAG TPA: response regulator transcription factor [Acidobacteriaceae bacterium]|nr:response regulator transcription factor [Acidobacteriaceae bacterium]